MTTATALQTNELTWIYPAQAQRPYSLRGDGGEVGWLQYAPEGRSAAQLAGCRWLLERSEGEYPRVAIRTESGDGPSAVFVPCPTGGGVVTFAGGRRYCWTRENDSSTRWCFRRTENRSLVCLFQEAGVMQGSSKVAIAHDLPDAHETAALVLLAWYLRLLILQKPLRTSGACC